MHARNANTTQRPGRSLSHPESVESDEGKTTKGTEEGGGQMEVLHVLRRRFFAPSSLDRSAERKETA